MSTAVAEKSVFEEKYADEKPKISHIYGALFVLPVYFIVTNGSLFLAFVGIIAVAAYVMREIRRITAFEGKVEQDYTHYLKSIPVETLAIASRSPELTEESRWSITNFLNKNHENWSFTHPTTL